MTTLTLENPAKSGLQKLRGWKKSAVESSELPDCTLCVPTFKRPREMVALLNHLLRLPDIPGEVVVVDGSPDWQVEEAVRTWAVRRALPFDLIYVKSPAGLTLQRNVAIDVSTREYIYYLDDDCLPFPGYFRSMRQAFADDATGELGAVRGFFSNSINAPIPWNWRLRFALRLARRGAPGTYYPNGASVTWNSVPTFKGVRPVDVLAGGASAYRRDVFAQHRFSEFFYGYAQGEDLEMSRRIAKDWKLVVCGDAIVNHNHADHGRPPGYVRGQMAVRNRFFIWKRHSPDARWVDKLSFWMDHVLIILYSLAGFCRSPRTFAPVTYAAGTLVGAFRCWTSPPSYEEPPARQEFEARLVELSADTTSTAKGSPIR